MSDHAPFLSAIVDYLDDDGPRLVYADFLEEQGEPARAELIRVQVELAVSEAAVLEERRHAVMGGCCDRFADQQACDCLDFPDLRDRESAILDAHGKDWMPPSLVEATTFGHDSPEEAASWLNATVWRRGFVEQIALHSLDFWGPLCRRCDGDGWAHGSDRPFEWSPDPDYLKCPVCKGECHIGGHAAAIFTEAPTIRRVTLPDRDPGDIRSLSGTPARPVWQKESIYRSVRREEAPGRRYAVPDAIFAMLAPEESGLSLLLTPNLHAIRYRSRQQAIDALFAGANVRWGREQAKKAAETLSKLDKASV